MSYDNTNSGALFKNKRKETERHPDYNGSLNVEGTEYWISAWIKEAGPNAKNPGEKFMSISITEKDAKRAANRPAPEIDADDIPF